MPYRPQTPHLFVHIWALPAFLCGRYLHFLALNPNKWDWDSISCKNYSVIPVFYAHRRNVTMILKENKWVEAFQPEIRHYNQESFIPTRNSPFQPRIVHSNMESLILTCILRRELAEIPTKNVILHIERDQIRLSRSKAPLDNLHTFCFVWTSSSKACFEPPRQRHALFHLN